MTLIATLLALHTLGLGAVAFLFWRRLEDMRNELRSVRTALDEIAAVRAQPARRRRANARLAEFEPDEIGAAQSGRVVRAWPQAPQRTQTQSFAPDALRALGVALMVGAPAAALLLDAPLALVAMTALASTLATLALSLRTRWRPAAWIGAIAGGGWALAGLLTGVAEAAPLASACGLVIAGAAGLAHARERGGAAGLALAGFMASAALAAGASADLANAHGAAFGALTAAAAIAGASSVRLEALFAGAFVAACLGVGWLSGSPQAQSWVAPAATLGGALFLGVAAVRAPQRGRQGLLIAGVGAAAPAMAAAALAESPAGAPMAALALAAAAAGLGAVLAETARRAGDMRDLGWTGWLIGAAAILSAASAAALIAPAPALASALALMSAGLALVHARAPHPLWRLGATALIAACAAASLAALRALVMGAPGGSLLAQIGLGAGAPALAAACAAWLLARGARAASAVHEGFAVIAAAATVALLVRLAFSGGAMLIVPVGFAEAGLHGAIWLGASVAAAAAMHRRPRRLRQAVAVAFAGAGLAAALAAAGPLNPWWGFNPGGAENWAALALGLAAPAAAAGVQFVFWREQNMQALARAALLLACGLGAIWVALETRRLFVGPLLSEGGFDATQAGIAALIVGAAIGACVLLWSPRARAQLPQQA